MTANAGPELRGMTLTVTEQCNLRCSYCHARRSDRRMSPAIADAAVDLFVRHSAQARRATISFYGGEPFLESRLLARVLSRVRRQAPADQQLHCTTPTNGMLLTRSALELCREHRMELVLSVDGPMGPAQRRLPNGDDSTPQVIARLAELVASGLAPTTVRMTVTPENVETLSENVKALARQGARSIVYQPALELEWSAGAVAAWQRENTRIATYIAGARALGVAPDVPGLSAIIQRLTHGTPRSACGAGVWHCAVATDGRLLPCYRLVFQRSEELELGTVRDGFRNSAALERWRTIDPAALRPEEGPCTACAARDGCTHFCPAAGHLLAGDAAAVPARVCALMRAQVAAVRAALGEHSNPEPGGITA